MTERPKDLPDYRQPPIDEVAIAVQFAAIEGYTNELARNFWREVREDYPFVENQPPLEIPLESATSPEIATIQFQFMAEPPKHMRLWLISENDDFLIQLQD